MPSFYWEVRGEAHLSFFVTANVPDFNHHKGTKTLRTPRISKLFLFFVPLWLCILVVSSRATLVVIIFLKNSHDAQEFLCQKLFFD